MTNERTVTETIAELVRSGWDSPWEEEPGVVVATLLGPTGENGGAGIWVDTNRNTIEAYDEVGSSRDMTELAGPAKVARILGI